MQSYRRILRLTPRPPSRTEAVPLVRALATCPLPPTSAFSGSLHLATLADGRDDRVGRRGEVVGELCERGARLLTTHRVNGQGPEAGEESAHLPRGRMTDGSRQVTSSQTEPLLANANQFKSSKSSQVKTSEDQSSREGQVKSSKAKASLVSRGVCVDNGRGQGAKEVCASRRAVHVGTARGEVPPPYPAEPLSPLLPHPHPHPHPHSHPGRGRGRGPHPNSTWLSPSANPNPNSNPNSTWLSPSANPNPNSNPNSTWLSPSARSSSLTAGRVRACSPPVPTEGSTAAPASAVLPARALAGSSSLSSSSASLRLAVWTTEAGKRAASATWMPKALSLGPSATLERVRVRVRGRDEGEGEGEGGEAEG